MEDPDHTVIPVTPAPRTEIEALLHQPMLTPSLRERLEMVKVQRSAGSGTRSPRGAGEDAPHSSDG